MHKRVLCIDFAAEDSLFIAARAIFQLLILAAVTITCEIKVLQIQAYA
jgi:hypothetical protein